MDEHDWSLFLVFVVLSEMAEPSALIATGFGMMEAQEINSEYSLEGLMLKLKLQHFDP